MIDEKAYNKEVGERLYKIRRVLKLTQEEIAAKVGMSVEEYRSYENGEEALTISQVMDIAELAPLVDRGYIIQGRTSYDYYIEAALKKIPKEEMQKIKVELGVTPENINHLSEDTLVEYNMRLYKYGTKHVNDKDLREIEPIMVFTQMFEQLAKEAMEA